MQNRIAKTHSVCFLICMLLCLHNMLPAQEVLNYELQEVNISEKLNPQKLTKNAASHFAAKFAGNFAAEIFQYRVVSCRDVYCELNAYKGVIGFWDFNRDLKALSFKNPAGYLHLAPLSVMRSDAYAADGVQLELTALYSDTHSCKNAFLSGYINHPWSGALSIKRAAELWSPLNPKMNSMYDYQVIRMFENKQDEQWAEIRFKSKTGVFPRKCRLMTEGTLLYNISRKMVQQLVLENYVDFYTTYVRKESFNGIFASKHRAEIRYEEREGKIFPVSITLDVVWQQPEDVSGDEFMYVPIQNSRRNPFKYKLKEREYVSFSRYRIADATLLKKWKGISVFGGNYVPDSFYAAPYDKAVWDRRIFPGLDMQRVRKDLQRGNGSLDEQCARNAIRGYEFYLKTNGNAGQINPEQTEKLRIFSKQYYKVTERELLPDLR